MLNIVFIYVDLIKRGIKTIEEIPDNLKEDVKNILKVNV